MATVTRENISNLHDRIRVTLTKEDYLPSFDKALKKHGKNANIPGFRKGNVPSGIIRKMYGPSLFQDEVMRSAGQELEKYLSTEKLDIFAQPMMSREHRPTLDFNTPSDTEFLFEIGLKPELNIPGIKGDHPMTYYRVNVSDKVLDDEVQRVVHRAGTLEDRIEVADKEDVLFLTIQPCDTDGQPIEDAEVKEEQAMVESLPASLQETVMGMPTGTQFTITPTDVATPEELPAFLQNVVKVDAIAADFMYQFTITKVGFIIPADINAELFEKVFPDQGVKDEASFREKIRTEVQKEYERIATVRLNDEIFEMLVHKTPIELPVNFLKRWMKEGGEKQLTDAEVEKEFAAYDHQLRWSLITEKIMKDHNISVEMEEIKENVKEQIMRYFGAADTEDAPWVDDFVKKQLQDEKVVNDTYRQLLMEKLFGFLRTRFNVMEQSISEEEFFKLPHPHAAHH